MDIQEFLLQLKEKYKYSDNLLVAIEKIIPLMISKYGVSAIADIKELFLNTEIHLIGSINKEKIDNLEDELFGDINPHVVEKEVDPYNSNSSASAYAYEIKFDENMNPIGEERCIITEDMEGRYNGDKYYELFGTTINVPYLIHELNHAFAMMSSKLEKDGNGINCKHGMYHSRVNYEPIDDGVHKYQTEVDYEEDIILEEMINEAITQDMLVELFNLPSYDEVRQKLLAIGFVPTSYNSLLITAAHKLINLFGLDAIMDYRKRNVGDLIERINTLAGESQIALEFVEGKPYQYFMEKCYELFQLSVHQISMSVEEYGEKSGIAFMDIYAVLMGVQESLRHDFTIEEYKEIRDGVVKPKENLERKEA